MFVKSLSLFNYWAQETLQCAKACRAFSLSGHGAGRAQISIISDELKILTRAYGLEPKLAPSLHPQEPDLTDCKLSILVRQQQKEIHAYGFPCFCAEALKQTFLRVSSYFKMYLYNSNSHYMFGALHTTIF